MIFGSVSTFIADADTDEQHLLINISVADADTAVLLQPSGGRIADKHNFGNNLHVIADTDSD